MSTPKKFQKAVILIIVLSISLQVPLVLSEETVDTSEVLYFLSNVANVDVSKYEPKLDVTTSDNPPELGGLSHVTGQYALESEDSKINVLFMFIDNTLRYCAITDVEGEIYQVEELPADIKGQADVFLQRYQRYQSYTADSTIQAMRNMLDTVDVTKNVVKVTDDLKLEVLVDSSSTRISWKNTFNGADYSGLGISFRNGTFAAFSQDWSYFKIGDTDVNLSEEDAVELALLYAKGLTWGLPDGTKVTEFTIVEDKIGTQLLTQPKEDPLTFYPYWLIILPLDKMYPGFVTQIMFQVYADTGEVIECTLLGQGGDVPANVSPSTPDASSTPPIQQGDEPLPWMESLIAITAVAAVVGVAVTVVAFKRKSKKPNAQTPQTSQ
jgi:hypothetical protein